MDFEKGQGMSRRAKWSILFQWQKYLPEDILNNIFTIHFTQTGEIQMLNPGEEVTGKFKQQKRQITEDLKNG